MSHWESYLATRQSRFLDELLDFLRIPSISSLPEHAEDVARAAEWVGERMKTAGLEAVRVIPTEGHPVVYGEWQHAPNRPTILMYGHFDVQPVDPLADWTYPPFAPTVADGRVYGRGASDMKGNLLLPIIAAETLLQANGSLPINLKFLWEGQEEIGSTQMPGVLTTYRDRLTCDLAISADSFQWDEHQPALVLGTRGACGLQIDVRGPETDLHSGMHGGAIQNPLHVLARIIASLHTSDGRVNVPGFYDDVLPMSDAERARIREVPFDEAAYRAQVGVDELFGEAGYSPLERVWLRPTLEVSGSWGGFQGEGSKAIVPGEAHARLSCRLVPDQDPDRVLELVSRHLRQNTPPGVRVTVTARRSRSRPYVVPAEHRANQVAREVLHEIAGQEPVWIRMGGSVPVLDDFQTYLGVVTLPFGFSLLDEKMHAPDEFFRLESFAIGQRAYCRLFVRPGKPRV